MSLRTEGRFVEALLVLLKQLTAHARWVFAILLVAYLASGVRTIQPGEEALLLRFGRLQPKVHGPGLLVGLPEPFDEILRFQTGEDRTIAMNAWARKGKKIEDPDKVALANALNASSQSEISVDGRGPVAKPEVATLDPLVDGYTMTRDFNLIQGSFVLRFRVVEPFRYVSSGDEVELLLKRLGYRALADQLLRRTIDASITSERDRIAAQAIKEIQRQVDEWELGVVITGLEIADLAPPLQVIQSFEDVVNARNFAKTLDQNSKEYEAKTLAKARGEAGAIQHRAEGFAAKLTGAAEGEAAGFIAILYEYQKSPELVSRRLLRDSLDVAFRRAESRALLPKGQAIPSIIIEPSPHFAR